MDAQTLSRAMGGSLSIERYQQLTPAFNAALIAADCTTVNRVAMWCAQVGHESGGLRWMEEIADGSAYEWRKDLGNVNPGDGRRFKGHGPIQITGRYNHTKVSEWAYSRGLVPTVDFFVRWPEGLASDEYGFLGVVWYWTVARNMNAYADARDINGATRAVNGGTNGLQDRINRWNQCLAIGDALLPDMDQENELMGAVADAVKAQLIGGEGKGFPILGVAEETAPDRHRYLTEAVAVILEQLAGPTVDGKSFGGWAQLGDDLKAKRTLVDGIGRVIEQNNEIIALLKGGK